MGLITSVKTGPCQKITLTYPSPSHILSEQRNPKSFQPQPHLDFAPHSSLLPFSSTVFFHSPRVTLSRWP